MWKAALNFELLEDQRLAAAGTQAPLFRELFGKKRLIGVGALGCRSASVLFSSLVQHDGASIREGLPPCVARGCGKHLVDQGNALVDLILGPDDRWHGAAEDLVSVLDIVSGQ